MAKRQRLLDPLPTYYVYILFDWFGIPFYVGKGSGNRIDAHEKKSDPRNQLKNEIIEQTWVMLEEIPKIIIRDQLSEVTAFEVEIALIGAIGRLDLGTGPLTNLTEGGDGCRLSFEQRSASSVKAMETIGPKGLRDRAVKAAETLGAEGLRAKALKACETLGKEDISARSIKINQALGKDGRRARMLKAAETLGEVGRRASRMKANATLGPEGLSARAIKACETLGPEGCRARAKKAIESQTPEQLSARARKAIESQTPEQLSARALKTWATRRAKKAAAELAALAAFTPPPDSGITNTTEIS